MDILVIMGIGILIGAKIFPQRLYRCNANLQLACTLALIFFMGVSLGARPNFFEELSTLGLSSLVFCLLPIAGSVALVYPLTQRFLVSKASEKEEDSHGLGSDC